MPMDIRSFFGAATGGKKSSSKTNAEAGSKSSTSSSKKNSTNTAKSKSSSSSTASLSTSRSSKKVAPVDNDNSDVVAAKHKRSKVIDVSKDDDDDDDTDIDSPAPSAKKQTMSSTNSSGSKRKRNTNVAKGKDDDDDEVVEVSPKDFFAISSSSKKSKNQKAAPVKSKDLWDDDDDDDVVVEDAAKASKMKKKVSSNSRYFSDSQKKGAAATSSKKKRTRDDDDEEEDNDIGDIDDDSDLEDTGKKNSKRNIADDSEDDDNDEDFEEPMDDDDDDDDDFVEDEEEKPKIKRSSPRKSPAKKAIATKTPSPAPPANKKSPRKSSPAPSRAKKTPETKKQKASPPLEPTLELDSFDVESCAVPECLQGFTFVFTGVLEGLGRDSAIDLVKCLGGRVTGAVSGKTNYLVVGEVLEDGRPYTEGSKYKKATAGNSSVIVIMGEKKLYGLCQLYQEQAQREKGIDPSATTPAKTAAVTSKAPSPPPAAATAAKPNVINPYAKFAKKAATVNPYAKKAGSTASVNPYAKSAGSAASVNPYAKPAGSASANPYAKTSSPEGVTRHGASNTVDDSSLWVDKHAPQATRDILGNKENVQKLTTWLSNWERNFNNPKSYGKAFSAPKGPWKAALLSGPPGIGKTTTATLVAKEAGRDLLEFNASDARSKKALQNQLGNVGDTESISSVFRPISKGNKKKVSKQHKCIIMDEVDGMGGGDRSGMAELIQMIKHSKVPIICICNDRQSQKMKSLLPYCMDLRFKRPVKTVLANRAIRIAEMEGLSVERNAAEAIAESCGNDVRQVLNCLQMWSNKQTTAGDNDDDNSKLTYKGLKEREHSINKDEILRVSLFDAAKTIMEGRRNLSGANPKAEVDSLFRRSDAFFVDYSMVGLLVQQNYPKVMQGQFNGIKRANDPHKEADFLDCLHDAALSMSDYAMVEQSIRGGDQNWSLLPACGSMAVKTGYHAGGQNGGFLPGFPEFTAWMGKNSTKGKKERLLKELHQHLNFKISGGTLALRESYLPVFRQHFMTLFQSKEEGATKEAIDLMDEYGLSREDIMEKLDEFKMSNTEKSFADLLDSKQKAAFTREYNQGAHTSQALVWEQGGGTTKRGGGANKGSKDPADLDAIDEDMPEEESENEDEEDLKKLQEKFKKKGRKKSGGDGGGKKKPANKGGKGKK